MKLKPLILSSVLAISSAAAIAHDKDVPGKLSVQQLDLKVAQYEEHQRKVAWEMAKIKTREALEELLLQDSPLDTLSPAAKERFVQSLVFREHGIGGFYYGDMQAELTATQAYKILALFGIQDTVSKVGGFRVETKLDAMLLVQSVSSIARDHSGYKCVSRANCKMDVSYICMSGC